MTKEQLENAIRELCDGTDLSYGDLADVLDALKVGYEMVAQDEAKD